MTVITIQVKMPGKNDAIRVEVDTNDTVAVAKQKMSGPCDTPAGRQRLIFCGRVLKDNQVLSDCKIGDNLVVHMVPRPAADSSGSPAATPAQPASQPPASTGGWFGAGATPAAGSEQTGAGVGAVPGAGMAGMFGAGGNPFAAFGGAGGGDMFGNIMNNPMMQQMQQQMLQNPEMLRQMMQNPMVQQMNQQLMSNPELLRSVISSNPHMQQLMENNPQLAHIMNDPALLREAMRLSQNPELLRETMRNADRSMTHIENIPGGFNYLASQYRDVTEPMTEAATQQANDMFAQNVPQRQAPAVPESPNPNNNPLPNPWAPPGAAGAAGTTGTTGAAGAAGANPMGAFMNMFGGAGAGGAGGDPNAMQSLVQQMIAQRQAAFASGAAGPPPWSPFASLYDGMAAGGPGAGAAASATSPSESISPEARFAVQLQQLNDMGFNDQPANIRNLVATGGNVNACVERLLQGL